MSILVVILNRVMGEPSETRGRLIPTPLPTVINNPLEVISAGEMLPTVPNVAGQDSAHGDAKVDVAAVLDGLAANRPGSLDWRHSLDDLLTAVEADTGDASKEELAAELGYDGDAAHRDSWLHRKLLRKFADNGGTVPEGLIA